jgi:predicted nucleic acid-binding protein
VPVTGVGDLKDPVAVETGAAHGIGLAVEQGADVVAIDAIAHR